MADGKVAHGKVAHGEVAHEEVAHGEVAHGEGAHGEVAHGEVAHESAGAGREAAGEGSGHAVEFRLLGEADLDGFAALHEEIRAAAPQGALSRRSRADLARLLEPGGFALGAFVLGRLAGFSCASRWRAGLDGTRFEAIRLPRAHWERTAVLTATAVAAWARGRGLQRLLLQERGLRLPGIGATHGAGVIHCANLASVANTLRAGEALRGVLDDEDGANYVSWRVARRVP